MRVPITVLLLFIVSGSIAPPARASGPAPHTVVPSVSLRHPLLSWRPVAWRPPASPAIAAGMRVQLDPATGEFVTPDAAHFPAAPSLRNARSAGVETITRPDGSRAVRLNGNLRKWSVASIGSDGKLQQDCVHSEAEAIESVRVRAASPESKGVR